MQQIQLGYTFGIYGQREMGFATSASMFNTLPVVATSLLAALATIRTIKCGLLYIV